MIISYRAVWPERLYGIDFFENSLEIRDSDLSDIWEKLSESKPGQGKRGSDIARSGNVMGWV